MFSISVWYIALAVSCCTLHLIQITHGAGDIVFPDERHAMGQPKCEHRDDSNEFCLKVKNYPKHTIENLLKRLSASDLQLYFSDTLEEEEIAMNTMSSSPAFSNRFGDDGEEALCYSDVNVLHPQALQDRKGINRTIANTEDFRQAVRVEQCKYPNNERRCKLWEHFPNNYKTECKQIYITKKLLVYTETNDKGELKPAEFKIPSCCQCIYKAG